MSGAWYLKSRRVAVDGELRPAAVRVWDERISAVVPYDAPEAAEAEDLGELALLPGLVDTHVHVNEPGRTEWEGFSTATRAAAAGGITTIVDMPLNSIPVTTSLPALHVKMKAAEKSCWVDCGFWGGVVPGNAGELLPMAAAGAAGFKAFLVRSGIDDFPNVTAEDLRQGLPVLARLGSPLLVHAELAPNEDAGKPKQGESWRYPQYLASRPKSWENEAVRLVSELCGEYRAPVHIVHLSSSEALAPLRQAKAARLPMTAETCPHYLYFASEQIPPSGTEYKCSPPIREAGNREQLWAALEDGSLDFIVSDHSPCHPALKCSNEGDFGKAWGGISSVQFTLSAVWTRASERGIGLERLADWMCRRPAEFAGFGKLKGRIAPGYDADFAVFDPEAELAVTPEVIEHRHKLTPYLGETLKGRVKATWLRGAKIYEDGNFDEAPAGRLLRRHYAA